MEWGALEGVICAAGTAGTLMILAWKCGPQIMEIIKKMIG